MSWGFFLDADLTLPTKDWERLKKTTIASHALPANWMQFHDAELGQTFLDDDTFDDMAIEGVWSLRSRQPPPGSDER